MGQEFVDEALQLHSKTGIRSFKIKAGSDPEADVENVRVLRQALGKEGFIFIDANQLYSPDVAIRTINRMAEHGLAMAEEPVAVGLGSYRKKVADRIPVPILADDSVFVVSFVSIATHDLTGREIPAWTRRFRALLFEAYGLP